MRILFWTTMCLIAYVYFGYPAMLWVLNRLKDRRSVSIMDDIEPTVSLIIAAYNEEKVIAQKLENSLDLNYYKNKLEIIVVSDGSTDKTADIVSTYEDKGIQLVNLPQNMGKASAQNEAVKQAKGDILLFSDANVSFHTRHIDGHVGENGF